MAENKNYFSKQIILFCCELLKKVFDFDQPTSNVIYFFLRSKGKKFGPKERNIIVNIVFSIVRSKSYFKSIIDNEKKILYGLNEFRCMIILGAARNLDKSNISPMLSDEEKLFLEKIKLNTIKEIYAQYSGSNLLHEKLSIPLWVFDDWVEQRGLAQTINFVESNNVSPPIYCRVNTLQNNVANVLKIISNSGYLVEQSSLIGECLKFLTSENINKIKSLFATGQIEVQDLGSQLVTKLVAPKRHSTVVDFCAGTGGKSLSLAVKMKNSGKVFALDINSERIAKLKSRVSKTNLKNIWPIVISGLKDERLFRFHGKVDAVLVDVPCSGLGTLRRHPELKWRVFKDDIAVKAKKQLEILKKASMLCKLGGYLVYATCSTIYEENESVIKDFLTINSQFERCDNKLVLEKQDIIFDKSWNVYDSYGNIQLWSDLTNTDSFFMTRLIRVK